MELTNSKGLISCGTTILAIEYNEGVVIGADSRTSCADYITNRVTDKLTRLSDKIYCCRSGAAAFTQILADQVATTLIATQLNLGEEPLVRDAAVQMRNRIYGDESKNVAGMIVAGWDHRHGGQVYCVPVAGFVVREACCSGGSGSVYIAGYLAAHYRPGMNETEAVDLIRTAVLMAIHNDCSSGGVVRIGIINKNGMQARICHRDEPEILRFTSDLLWQAEFGFF